MAIQMEKVAAQVLIFSLLAALFLQSSPAVSQEVEDESEFNYDERSDRGPSHWGDIKPEWILCKNGTMQSPIDLKRKRAQISQLGPLQLNYKPSNTTIENRGHDIKLEWVGGTSYLQIDGTRYVLKQFHWHYPSEHTIDGKRFDLELHMVHESGSGRIAVIGVLYKIGKADRFLSLIRRDIEEISNTPVGTQRATGIHDPRVVGIEREEYYYRYMGSLTTPPCSENVIWTVIKEVRTVSRKQIRLLRDAIHDHSGTNARPLQPTNNRLVLLNKPRIQHQH